MSAFLIDTNVFSKIFKGDIKLAKFVEKNESYVDTTIYIECLQGSKSNREKRVLEKFLQKFPLLPIMPVNSVIAIGLIRKYSNSHGLLLADALIASTALESGLTILTHNIKDFSFIDGLKYLKPSV